MTTHATPAISSSVTHNKRFDAPTRATPTASVAPRPVASVSPGMRTRTSVRAGFVVVREAGSGSASPK